MKPTKRQSVIRNQILSLILILGMSVFTHTVSRAYAQEKSVGLSISPPLDVVDIGDRDHLTLAFTVENITSQDMLVTPTVRTFSADQTSGAPVLDDGPSPSFVTVETPGFALEKPFSLAPGKQQQLVLGISIPTHRSSDITLTFLAQGTPVTEGTLSPQNTETRVRTVVGANMILRTKSAGGAQAELTLEQFLAPSILDIFSPLELKLLGRNSDNTTHQTHGSVTLSQGDAVRATHPLSPDFILPGSARMLRFTRDENGTKIPEDTRMRGPFLPGQYTVTVSLGSEDGSMHTYTTTILVLPISIILLSLALVCIFGLGFYVRRRKK